MRVALGTAIALGLAKGKQTCPPTTAHFLLGNGCEHSCAYCDAKDSLIARISWPEFPEERILNSSFSNFSRICLQLTSNGLNEAIELIPRLPLKTSVSLRASGIGEIRALFFAGANRVSVPLDACTQKISETVGRGDLEERLTLLSQASREFPGKIGTHLIIGLGERERDAVELMKKLTRAGILIALFAFTPVKGSALSSRPPPHIGAYRRVQIARSLLMANPNSEFAYNSRGQIISLPASDGLAFMTSGCPDCNRPYFDGPPNKPFNFPCAPSELEAKEALMQSGIYDGKSIHKAGKLIKISLTHSEKIESIEITGDFFAHPEEGIERLQEALVGCPVNAEKIKERIEKSIAPIEVFGFDPDSLTEAIMKAIN